MKDIIDLERRKGQGMAEHGDYCCDRGHCCFDCAWRPIKGKV